VPTGLLAALAALALTLGTGALWFRRMHAVALPSDRTPFVLAMALAATLGVGALVHGAGWLGGAIAVVAIVPASVFVLLVAISAQKGSPGAFRLGEPLPDFTAQDDTGQPFRLSSQSGKPLLLKFFRGHW
jgi:uncharacterized membrane protein YhaH (DUF805 family)